jgi:hypothetical protein
MDAAACMSTSTLVEFFFKPWRIHCIMKKKKKKKKKKKRCWEVRDS